MWKDPTNSYWSTQYFLLVYVNVEQSVFTYFTHLYGILSVVPGVPKKTLRDFECHYFNVSLSKQLETFSVSFKFQFGSSCQISESFAFLIKFYDIKNDIRPKTKPAEKYKVDVNLWFLNSQLNHRQVKFCHVLRYRGRGKGN